MKFINKFLNYIIIVGCVGVAGLMFLLRPDTKKDGTTITDQSSKTPVFNSNDPQNLANKFLRESEKQLTINELNAKLNLKKALLISSQVELKGKETDPNTVTKDQQIWKESNATEATAEPVKKVATFDKKEYIRQFKENARKNGYEITVSDDLEVTSVTPIRKPQNNGDYDENNMNQPSDN